MKKITARFKSRCAETGKPIKKGDEMVYDYTAKKCYCMSSETAKKFNEPLSADKQERRSTSAYIQAQEDAYWDNQTGGYYSR